MKKKSLFINILFAGALTACLAAGSGLHPLLAWFIAINTITLYTFNKDKSAAENNKTRTPEITFHLLGLLGAFPAIFAGRKFFRHKTIKSGFIIPMWIFFFIQLLGAFYLVSSWASNKEVYSPFDQSLITPAIQPLATVV